MVVETRLWPLRDQAVYSFFKARVNFVSFLFACPIPPTCHSPHSLSHGDRILSNSVARSSIVLLTSSRTSSQSLSQFCSCMDLILSFSLVSRLRLPYVGQHACKHPLQAPDCARWLCFRGLLGNGENIISERFEAKSKERLVSFVIPN
jgi:hypothetical protein